MHLARFDLNLFIVLDTIATEGNITRAARKLHLTQPAVSHALGRLREQLGDPLFVRQGTQMQPTPYARSLLGPVRDALLSLEQSVAQEPIFNPATARRTFHLGLRDVFEATMLPPLIARLQQTAPGVTLASVRVDRREVESELAAGTLDLALDVPLAPSEELCRQRVSRDRLVVVARANHPGINHALSLDTYLAWPHVLVSSRRKGRGLEDHELDREGKQRQIILRCQHYFAACRVVSRSDLLLTMPEQYARIANTHFDNRILPFPLPTQALDAHLYWHAGTDRDPANRWLREVILSLAGALDDDCAGDFSASCRV